MEHGTDLTRRKENTVMMMMMMIDDKRDLRWRVDRVLLSSVLCHGEIQNLQMGVL